ncbi:MAG TPA: hypothetical protein VLT33_10245 [Labilithrix sp.]|nr:hypothetical protein [Labilithrix sp.]
MRHPWFFGSVASGVILLVGLYTSACGGNDGGGGTAPPFEAGTADTDGAVIDPPDAVIDPPDTNKPSKVNVTNHNINVAGDPRFYVLSVPKTYDASKKYPLIIAMHGDGQNADGFRQFLGFDEITGDDAITAYTDGVVDLFTDYDQNGDQQLVEAVINELKGKLSIDSTKIWGFGYSKGGFIANELACRRPGLFTAITAHATGGPQETSDKCPGILPIPILLTQGDRDLNIGANFAAEYWASVNGCGTNRVTSAPAECQKYTACPSSKPVVYCLAPGVSHFPIWNQATTVSWAFFRSL